MPKIYIPKRSLEQLYKMREIWLDSDFAPTDVAFRIRAIELARIECRIHQVEQQEDQNIDLPTRTGIRQFDVVFVD